MRADKRLVVSQIATLCRMWIHRKRSVDLFETLLQAKMKSLLLLLLVTFAKASPTFERKLVSSNKYLIKDVRVQNSHVQIFLKLWLQVEDDKIRLKT